MRSGGNGLLPLLSTEAMALNCKTCYFTFGRFQPPTTGHKENFNGEVYDVATGISISLNKIKQLEEIIIQLKSIFLDKMYIEIQRHNESRRQTSL